MQMSRYPDYVCEECVSLAVDENGNSVSFSNEDVYGGLIGHVVDARTGKALENDFMTAKPEFLIRGVPCYASEAHFGGVVIRPKTRRQESPALRGDEWGSCTESDC